LSCQGTERAPESSSPPQAPTQQSGVNVKKTFVAPTLRVESDLASLTLGTLLCSGRTCDV